MTAAAITIRRCTLANNVRVEVKGLSKLLRQMGAIGGKVEKAVCSALFIEGESIMAKSKELVPVDTGALRASGTVKKPVKDKTGKISVSLEYGGVARGVFVSERTTNVKKDPNVSEYALKVHEDLSAWHIPPTQAKYLEMPFREAMSDVRRRVARDIADALRRL